MANDKYTQKAGDNSTQIQSNLVQIGIDEKRVREILKEEKQRVLKEIAIIAENVAQRRLNNYTDVLVPKLVKAELLDNFSDPKIQMLFRQSEKTAVCTDRNKDYELLSELLIHRIKRDGNYTTGAAIKRAIDEVDNLSDDALLGLTIIFAIDSYVPVSGDVHEGLQTLNNLYGKIMKSKFVNIDGKSWLENLEIINAIRINPLLQNKRLEDIYLEAFDGYFSLGIKKDSDNYNKAIEILQNNQLPLYVLSENILDNNYVRVNNRKKKEFKDTTFIQNGIQMKMSINEQQKQALSEITDLYEDNNSVREKYIDLLKSYEYINALILWWDNNMIDTSFNITSIGKVIAYTNAKSIDSTLPDLD